MSYQCFIIKPQDYAQYPEIPEYHINRQDADTLMVGAADDESGELAGLMTGSAALTDSSVVHVSYVWCRSHNASKGILAELLPAFITCLRDSDIKKICFRLAEINGNTYGFLTGQMLTDAGCIKIRRQGMAGGYVLADFYDTLFMRSNVIKASQNAHLLSFAACSRDECRKYLDELFGDTGQKDFSLISYSPFSFFYMKGRSPAGVITLEHYGRSGCIVDDVYIKDTADRKKVFLDLLAGAFSRGLSGLTVQTCVFTRLSGKEDYKVMEECLGEQGFETEISDYEYDL